jgi:hypothetical protein
MSVIRRYSNTTVPTALASAISGSQTTITTEGLPGGYPDPPFALKVGDAEIVLVTEKTLLLSGQGQLTVVRGYDGTSAASHLAGEDVRHVAIAADFEYRWQDTVVNRPWGTYDDEFDDDTLDPSWASISGGGTATWTERNGLLSVLAQSTLTSRVSALAKNLTSATPLIYAQVGIRLLSRPVDHFMLGPFFSNGQTSTADLVWVFLRTSASNLFNVEFRSGKMELINVIHHQYTLSPGLTSGWVHLRVRWTGLQTFDWLISPDGVSWTQFGAGSVVRPITPTHAGIAVSTWGGGTVGIGTVEYFRVGN